MDCVSDGGNAPLRMLRSLLEGGIPGQKNPGGPSFIEHVNALVDTYEKVSFQRPATRLNGHGTRWRIYTQSIFYSQSILYRGKTL